MKVIFIKKIYIYLFLITIILGAICFKLGNYSNSHTSVFNPIKNNTYIDINADGINDEIIILDNKVEIIINGCKYPLSTYLKNNSLSSSPKSWPCKIFTNNLSRNLKPELIIQSNNNKVSTISILQWHNNNFFKIYSEDKNIFGILHSNNSKTPTCYSLNSSEGNASLKSFIIDNNTILDTTKFNTTIPGLNNILTFIDLVQKDYELNETPDIFLENIPSEELGILWNLDKENFTYSFQDSFFIDDFIDNDGTITSMIWRLTFEKYNKGADDSSKKEIVLYVTSELTYNNEFKISGITIHE